MMRFIGRYQILGLLGRGGMSQVFKVVLPATGRIKALKLLSPRDQILTDIWGQTELERIFAKEARLMASLRHPYIAAVEDFDHHNGQPFFTMEHHSHNLGLVLGETYRVEEDSRRLSVESAVGYTRQILLGLERMHDAGIVHRDIKPFNILLTEENEVKIIDFGLSQLRGELESRSKGIMIGSPYYAAPEQEQDPTTVDGRADLYGVGIMLWRMFTGRLVSEDTGYSPWPSQANSDLNKMWDDFLLQAVAVNPENRFASAGAMLLALENCFSAWLKDVEASCRLEAQKVSAPPLISNQDVVRHQPRKISLVQGREMFRLDGLWRPVHYWEQNFTNVTSDVVLDSSTNLVWHSRGSRFSMPWAETKTYLNQLQAGHLADRTEWRLPTIDELTSVLQPAAQGHDLCLAPVFDPGLRWIWSSDRSTFTSAWIADVRLGYIGRLDMDGLAKVCAVCSINEVSAG